MGKSVTGYSLQLRNELWAIKKEYDRINNTDGHARFDSCFGNEENIAIEIGYPDSLFCFGIGKVLAKIFSTDPNGKSKNTYDIIVRDGIPNKKEVVNLAKLAIRNNNLKFGSVHTMSKIPAATNVMCEFCPAWKKPVTIGIVQRMGYP